MLEEKEIEISVAVSKKDAGKKFIVRQIPATKMKKLLFECQNVYNYDSGGGISVNSEKKEDVYYSILNEINCKVVKDGQISIHPLKKTEADAFVEDANTLDFLVNKFVELNLGEGMSLMQKSLDNLMGVC